MINPQWLELPMFRTNFHSPRDVRAIEVTLYIAAYEDLKKHSLRFSIFCVFFGSKGILFVFLFYSTAAGVKCRLANFYFHLYLAGSKCRVATVKRLPVLQHSADNIIISFGIIEPIVVIFKIEYL